MSTSSESEVNSSKSACVMLVGRGVGGEGDGEGEGKGEGEGDGMAEASPSDATVRCRNVARRIVNKYLANLISFKKQRVAVKSHAQLLEWSVLRRTATVIVKLYLASKRPLHTISYVTDFCEWRHGCVKGSY